MPELAITVGIIILTILIVIIAIGFAVSRFYVKAPADRTYVRTGSGKPRVVFNGGGWVLPALHEVTWVDLRTMDIDIERTEGNALLTIDPQYADIRAIFYIKVNPIAEDIERAARTIGGGEVNTDSVKRLVESKLEGALRDVAATFTLMSLHQEREKFVERVQNLVRADLAENGLVLESVSITTLKSARQGSFGIDDVFGAQVARANAQVIQNALRERNEIDQLTQTEIAKRNATAEQERSAIERGKQLEISRHTATSREETNTIERNAELEIAKRNATVEQEKLSLERNIAQAKATQQREILIREAEERSAAEKAAYEQQQAAELARVIKERAIAEAEQEKEQAVQLAEQRRQQATQLAEEAREREVQRSAVLREQAIQIANQERLIALAQEQARLESAEQERLKIAAEKEAAEQEVFTVQEKAAAQREAQIQIIHAERDAQREMINRKNEVELQAFKRIKEAEAEATALNQKADAEATAAIKMAEARRTEAQASTDADKLRAEASRAIAEAPGLAEAAILKAKAEAAQLEAEAIKARGLAEADSLRAKGIAEAEGQRALADALAAHEGISQALEIERLRISAQIEVGVAKAKAMGEAVAAMDFKLYGTPEAANQLLRLMSLSDGLGDIVQAAPAPIKDLSGRLIDRLLPAKAPEQSAQTNGAAAVPVFNVDALQPLLQEAHAIATTLLNEDQRGGLSISEAITLGSQFANAEQKATLLKLQGVLTLMPSWGELKVNELLKLGH